MPFITDVPSSPFVVIVLITLACATLWVAYSIQEFLFIFRKHQKNRALRHQKELELYRQELKK